MFGREGLIMPAKEELNWEGQVIKRLAEAIIGVIIVANVLNSAPGGIAASPIMSIIILESTVALILLTSCAFVVYNYGAKILSGLTNLGKQVKNCFILHNQLGEMQLLKQ